MNEHDVDAVIDAIEARGPRLVALSAHDSTDWTRATFERRFGERFQTLRRGEELLITAPETAATVRP